MAATGLTESQFQNGGDDPIEVSFNNNIAVITMKRGENRLNEKFVEKMNAALDEVLRNPDVVAVVTTGEGKFYSNGLDLSWFMYLNRTDPDRLDRFLAEGFTALSKRLLTFPLPTIALINGHAFAAGGLIALKHDHVIMQNHRGWFCLNEVLINLRFSPFLMEFMEKKLPTGRTAHEVVVLGRRYTGDEAAAAGIAHESCPPREMFDRAVTWVKQVVPSCGYNREHLQTMKEDVFSKALEALKKGRPARFGSQL